MTQDLDHRSPPPGRLYSLAWGFYLALALAGVLWIGLRLGVVPLALFVAPRGSWVDLGLGAAAGLLLIGAWEGMRLTLPLARELEVQLAAAMGVLDHAETLGLAALSGFAEELFFRGAVQGAFGWLAACALFALLHTGPSPAFRLWTVFAAAAGLIFCGLMLWRGNLLAPIVAHFLVNAVNLRRLTSRHGDSVRLAGDRQQSEKES
ncbi:MAG: CPBP family intramembrane metalloprotease [Acidobacteriota bacterium]|nr:CPBP family intramembrane metalloprotease [Acidobacteriota bacterium]